MRVRAASLPALLDEAQHAQALTWLAADSLVGGVAESAFLFADRRCRLQQLPSARHFLLRAEAARRLGRAADAKADLERALEVDPTDALVNGAVLASSDLSYDHERAARAILEATHGDFGQARMAIAALRRCGTRGVLCVRRSGTRLSGWAAWHDEGDPVLRIGRDGVSPGVPLRPDPAHPLREALGHAAAIVRELPSADGPVPLSLLLNGETLDEATIWTPAAPAPRRRVGPPAGRSRPAAARSVAVIVPVYDDLDATRTCLRHVEAQRPSAAGLRVIVVDDASPNARIAAFLDEEAQAGRVELIRNASNLGFAASVNVALAATGDEDVLLLNADAYVPPGAVARLAALARSAADIGTLTPFSNNGEFVSFPLPNRSNPLPLPETAAALDEAAAAANAGTLVDVPSGTGFCLFITRACLDAVGPLSSLYVQGYYEDVDFCLQARAAGFRNVCATSVYVAHEGSRSFGPRKRALVARNLAILKRRYPEHEAACRAYVLADPLQPARSALEPAVRPPEGATRLLVAGSRLLESGLKERARQLATQGHASLLLSWRLRGDRLEVDIEDSIGHRRRSILPQAAEARLDLPATIERIEVEAPNILPAALREALVATARAMDLLVMCGSELGSQLPPGSRQQKAPYERIVTLDAMSFALATKILGGASVPILPPPAADKPERGRPGGGPHIGILAPVRSAAVDRLLLALGSLLRTGGPDPSLIVLGESDAALQLLAQPRVFVTGRIAADEYDDMLRRYSIGRLFLPYRDQLFWLVDALARANGLPAAFFDWSTGAHAPRPGDLALAPGESDAAAAAELAGWTGLTRSVARAT